MISVMQRFDPGMAAMGLAGADGGQKEGSPQSTQSAQRKQLGASREAPAFLLYVLCVLCDGSCCLANQARPPKIVPPPPTHAQHAL